MKKKLKWLVNQNNSGEVIDKSHWGSGSETLFTCAKQPLESDFHGFPEWKRTTERDLLLTRNGTPYIHIPHSGAIYSNVVQRITVKGVDRRFLKYALMSRVEDFRGYGVSIESFNYDMWGNLDFEVPERGTQTQIADFLDQETSQIDSLVDKKRRQISILHEKEKTEISEIANRGLGHTDFLTHKELSWRGLIPHDWNESRLKAHFRQSKRQGFDDLEVLSVYREFGVIKKSSRTDNNNKTPEDLSKYQLVEPGDLVINKMKAWQGSLGISRFRGIVSPDYVVMVPTSEHHPAYMHHLLRAKPMPSVYEKISNGIRLAQWRLEPYKFLCLPIFLPSIQEQKELSLQIDRALKRSRTAQKAIKSSIDLLLEKRAALITAAVTGQLDVMSSASVQVSANDNVPLLVAAEIIRKHERSQKFGRVKFQKIVYLAEAHCGVHELGGKYQREAAGPLDRVLLNNLECQLAETGLYRAEQTQDGGAVTYKALGSSEDKRNAQSRALGERADPFRDMLAKLRDMDTHAVEAITTLYAVWNDFLIDGEAPDDRAIITGVLQDWHPEKKDKFSTDELQIWLGWMRRNDFIPKGQGPRTSTGRLFV